MRITMCWYEVLVPGKFNGEYILSMLLRDVSNIKVYALPMRLQCQADFYHVVVKVESIYMFA